jgi:hypothetical protein
MGLSASLASHAASFFEQGARPAGILRIPHKSVEDTASIGVDMFEHSHGLKNAHKIALVSSTEPLDFTPTVRAAGRLAVRRAAAPVDRGDRAHLPRPALDGRASSGDSMTYSNTESQALAFVTHSCGPGSCSSSRPSARTPTSAPARSTRVPLDALLRADSKTRSEVYTVAWTPPPAG